MANVLNYRNDPEIIQHIKDQIKIEQVGNIHFIIIDIST
jgi:hypothetical protein